MKKHRQSPLLFSLFLVALILLTFGCNAVNKGGQPSVRVGANLPLTGELASYGQAVMRGVRMAVDEFKQSDPTGPALDFDWQDNAGSPQTAVSIVQQQLLRAPAIYTSGVKPQTAAISQSINQAGLPQFVWVFDAFINKDTHNNFRTWLSFKIEPTVFLSYADSRKSRRVAIAFVQLPNTEEEYFQFVVPGLKKRGLTDRDILVDEYALGTKDFRSMALKFRAFHPDLIILNGFQLDLVGLIRAFRPLGLVKDGNVIAAYDMLDAAELLKPEESEGIRVAAPVFATQPDLPRAASWRVRFQQRYSKAPLYTDAFAYDMGTIIHDAAKRLKLPASSPQWIEALRATNIEGITGPLKFDADNDLQTPLEVGVFRGGKLSQAER
jgi:branched-chain amino acid transport system substrate-binding protein